MVEAFRTYCQSQGWDLTDKRTLIAVSGGVDSVLLAHLFHLSSFEFAVAHCNFQLRGEASEKDHTFVEQLAANYSVPFFSISFDTLQEGQKRKQSVQEVARSLRYSWLQEMSQQHQLDYIATAHHRDDAVETMLFNLVKGCGIRGLHGILPEKGNVIRPLLFTNKRAILQYAQEQQLSYREDASNQKTDYSRNLIRLKIIPLIEQINPSFLDSAATTIQRLRATEILFDQLLETLKPSIIKEEQDLVRINLTKLVSHPARHTILYEFTKAYGIHPDQVDQIWAAFGKSGRIFQTSDFQLLLDREQLLIKPLEQSDNVKVTIERAQGTYFLGNHQLSLTIKEELPDFFDHDDTIAFLDVDTLTFPLIARKWKDGDRFQPLGMKGKHQKVKDFLINKKINLFEKQNTWVLESENNICWLVGHRIGAPFKITAGTKQVLQIKFQ